MGHDLTFVSHVKHLFNPGGIEQKEQRCLRILHHTLFYRRIKGGGRFTEIANQLLFHALIVT